MHGMMFSELEKYAVAKLGARGWEQVRAEAGQRDATYLLTQAYGDDKLVALVGAACTLMSVPLPALLEDFGRFLVPTLMSVYAPLVAPEWRTLDLIEHSDRTMHKVVRLRNPGADPPVLAICRIAPNELLLTYGSPRRLCFLAEGIAQGIGQHYDERVLTHQRQCMYEGAAQCEISIKTV